MLAELHLDEILGWDERRWNNLETDKRTKIDKDGKFNGVVDVRENVLQIGNIQHQYSEKGWTGNC